MSKYSYKELEYQGSEEFRKEVRDWVGELGMWRGDELEEREEIERQERSADIECCLSEIISLASEAEECSIKKDEDSLLSKAKKIKTLATNLVGLFERVG